MHLHIPKKLKKLMRRTLALSLTVLMLTGAASASFFTAYMEQVNQWLGDLQQEIEESRERAEREWIAQMQELYGEDWEKVTALQPGDSYISGDTMYVCREETYVDWTRVKTREDLSDAYRWGDERLLLLTGSSRYDSLFLGNDIAESGMKAGGVSNQMVWEECHPNRIYSNGSGADGQGWEYAYPELYAIRTEAGWNGYPDTFTTKGTMNAPYLSYVGTDPNNENQPTFKIILSKDNGERSGVALSHKGDGEKIELTSVEKGGAFTFYVDNSGVRIFENIEDEDDMGLVFQSAYTCYIYGAPHENRNDLAVGGLNAYIGQKYTKKDIEVISLKLEDAEQDPNNLKNVYDGTLEFYRWEKITSSTQLPTDKKAYRMLLVWNNKYFLEGDDFRRKDGDKSMALYVNEEKGTSSAPGNVAEYAAIDLSQKEFYSAGGMNTPYMTYTHNDGDSDYDKCPYYEIQLAGADDRPSEKLLCDFDNDLGVCLDTSAVGRPQEEMRVGIIVGKEGDDDNDASSEKVKLFFKDYGYDTGFYHSGNILYGQDDWSDWEYSEFTLYIGRPVTYPAISQNFVVGEDQFVRISENGGMYKNVTIIVEKGGVLSIESWFMNNGRIIVDGGTLIVQVEKSQTQEDVNKDTEDSVLMPFVDIHNSSGALELKNGGELIVLENARAAFGSIDAQSGSSILNAGMLLAETVNLRESTLENRGGGSCFFGYDFREMPNFRTNDVIKESTGNKLNTMVTRLHESVACLVRWENSCITNDGSITYATVRSSIEDPSVKEVGSGPYLKYYGKKAKTMLPES